MGRIHIQTPNARPMNLAVQLAFKEFGVFEPLGGPSPDGWSTLSDYMRCPYRFYLRHEQGQIIHPDALIKVAPAPDIGVLMHVVLALRYARLLPEGYPGWNPKHPGPLEMLDAVQAAGAELLYVQEVRRLYYAYEEHYGAELDIQPVAIEYGAGTKGIHTCRYDMLAWEQGSLWNFEHKTAGFKSPDVLESWWLDGEIIGEVYTWQQAKLDEVFGGPLAGVKINLIFKTAKPEFTRLEIVYPQKVIDSFIRDAQYWRQQREGMRKRGHWPRALNGCITRYDMCQYWTHCRDEDASVLCRPEDIKYA